MPHAVAPVRVIVTLCLTVVLLTGLGRATAATARQVKQAESRLVTGYRKGRPLTITLVSVDWVELEQRTARAFRRMQRAASRDGVTLAIRSGFRSHAEQIQLYAAWLAGWGNRAARPGHSNHQNGRAIDVVVDQAETFAWLAQNARGFGFKKTVRDEPWHWEYLPRKRRRGRTLTASGGSRSGLTTH